MAGKWHFIKAFYSVIKSFCSKTTLIRSIVKSFCLKIKVFCSVVNSFCFKIKGR